MSDYFEPRLLAGDCIERLRSLEPCSIDAIVTDPPYELSFMGKKWDATGIAYSLELWAECLRVLKPGGHLLAFGGTRTYHRMACAIEDAGFEVRDSIHWTYGSGFPKSLDVSKAMDKAAGAEREVVGEYAVTREFKGRDLVGDASHGTTVNITAPATDLARKWQGWGTALKPSHEPVVVARKPLAGTVAGNVLAHGTGALNIDASRVGTEGGGNSCRGGDACACATSNTIYGATKHPETDGSAIGRWPANTVLTHAAGCRQTGYTAETTQGSGSAKRETVAYGDFKGNGGNQGSATVTQYACVAGCPVAELDRQSGVTSSGKPTDERGKGGIWQASTGKPAGPQHGDTGGASRFFTQANWDEEWDGPQVLYVPKPSKREKNAGLDDLEDQVQDPSDYERAGTTNPRNRSQLQRKNFHPTTKPVACMRHLVRLVTPPGGVVLDPFLGSGTTAVAAILEGFEWKGCELTEDYLPIIKGRVEHARAAVRKAQQQAAEAAASEQASGGAAECASAA